MNSSSAPILSAGIHAALRARLFPGDGREAAAILICSSSPGSRLKLLARNVIPAVASYGDPWRFNPGLDRAKGSL